MHKHKYLSSVNSMNKNRNPFLLVILVVFMGCFATAQTKKWTIKECVNYALTHNISIMQSDLDIKSAAIDQKSSLGSFLPTLNADASHS